MIGYTSNYFLNHSIIHMKAPRKIKQSFTTEEDRKIITFVLENGSKFLEILQHQLPHRSTRQLRERYRLCLNPDMNRSPFSSQENERLVKSYHDFNGSWCVMTQIIPGRTDVPRKYR
jgi:hypothetical protein